VVRRRSPKAAARFVLALDEAIDKIREAPERWPSYVSGTRRYRLRRFPYLIVYRLRSEWIEIIACQHARRRPGYWKGRLG
jgi:toxin ParE1/3/4